MFTRSFFVLIMLLFTGSTLCRAQENNIWTKTKAAPRKAKAAVQKQGSRIKKFRQHLERWGLDADYTHGIAIGARLTSSGWAGLAYYQHRRSKTQNEFIQLSLSGVKDEKEIRQQRTNTAYPELGASTPFVFGKTGQLYLAQLGYGREQLLLPGVLEGNISVSLKYSGGVSLAMLKPYYLKLIYDNGSGLAEVREERYSDANSERFLNSGRILGAAKWKQGLKEIDYVPGIYVDAAIAIEALKNKAFIKTVTLGGQVSLYTKALPLMAERKAHPWQAYVYAGLSIGKRWR